MNDLEFDLIVYGTRLLASCLGQPWPPPDTPPKTGTLAETALQRTDSLERNRQVRLARDTLLDTSPLSGLSPGLSDQPVSPVFELLRHPPGVVPLGAVPNRLSPLNFWQRIPDAAQTEEDRSASASELWGEFWTRMQRLTEQSRFDTFFFLLAYCGWNVPGTIEDPLRPGFEHGISVFEQFKAVAALSHLLNPDADSNQPISLIGGDLPGIQRVLYTITAKGAAKTLRGHSAYLLMLSDCLVRLVLGRFGLPWANVVFTAGGNFLIAGPAEAEEKLEELSDEINDRLLDLHRGELFLAMAGITIPAILYAERRLEAETGSLAEKRSELQLRLEASKQAAFARLAKKRYGDLFDPMGEGGAAVQGVKNGNLCEICHTEIGDGTRVFQPEDTEAPEESGLLLCEQCHSFAYPPKSLRGGEFKYDSLAWSVANADRLFISKAPERPTLQKYSNAKGNPPWNIALQSLGLDCRFIAGADPVPSGEGILLSFDPKTFLPETPESDKTYGFRFMSRLTPRKDPAEKKIRDTHQMASEDAIGIHRYGVLRMDVDALGETMSGAKMIYPDLLHLSALSSALDLFFGGMLDPICRDTTETWQKRTRLWNLSKKPKNRPIDPTQKHPYIIYAGGDDLFIIASWDLLPPLAQGIQKSFNRFCLNRLTLSGGISIAREKYPLYRVAEQAGLALEQSKDREVKDIGMLVRARKNALTFLGVTLAWDELDPARDLAEKLVGLLIENAEGQKAPRALLQVLNLVARLYRREADSADTGSIKLGSWLWILHYGLRRMQRRVPEAIRLELATIPNQILEMDRVRIAGDQLRQLEESRTEADRMANAERDFRNAITEHLDKARTGWPTIRYLGLPVHWAEFLTRKEE